MQHLCVCSTFVEMLVHMMVSHICHGEIMPFQRTVSCLSFLILFVVTVRTCVIQTGKNNFSLTSFLSETYLVIVTFSIFLPVQIAYFSHTVFPVSFQSLLLFYRVLGWPWCFLCWATTRPGITTPCTSRLCFWPCSRSIPSPALAWCSTRYFILFTVFCAWISFIPQVSSVPHAPPIFLMLLLLIFFQF